MVDSKDDDWYLYADDFDLNVPQVCSDKLSFVVYLLHILF